MTRWVYIGQEVKVQGKFPIEEKLLCASKDGSSSPCIFVGNVVCYACRR